MSKVRFAILGFGHHAGRRLVPAFIRSREAELVGLWRRNPEATATDAQAHGLRAFRSAEELCSSPEVDVVFITSPDALHLADAELAFRHGKAILCEKPLAMNAGQAAEMAAAADRAGLLFGVGQNFRFNHSLAYLREAIAQGRIGTPQLAHAQYSYMGTLAPRTWITDRSLACGGPIADVGVHCIDSLRFILGVEVKSISALASRDEHSDEVEATASLQMEMSGGVFANVTVTARAVPHAGRGERLRRCADCRERADGGPAGGGGAPQRWNAGRDPYRFERRWLRAHDRRVCACVSRRRELPGYGGGRRREPADPGCCVPVMALGPARAALVSACSHPLLLLQRSYGPAPPSAAPQPAQTFGRR